MNEREWSKKFVQQGRSPFDARSVLVLREHGKRRERRWRIFSTFPYGLRTPDITPKRRHERKLQHPEQIHADRRTEMFKADLHSQLP